MRRVNVRGTSGSGKTTTSRRLAQVLGVPFIELDALHHGPNWSGPTAMEFRARVEPAIADAPNGWVIDGSYASKLGDLVLERADTLVWLDLPLHVSLRRLWRRTWRRILRKEELWAGNRESIRAAFLVRDSLFAVTIKRHHSGRGRIRERIERNAHLDVVHLRTTEEVERFLHAVAKDERKYRPPQGQCTWKNAE
jgi:adenylate kinase family enzyme